MKVVHFAMCKPGHHLQETTYPVHDLQSKTSSDPPVGLGHGGLLLLLICRSYYFQVEERHPGINNTVLVAYRCL